MGTTEQVFSRVVIDSDDACDVCSAGQGQVAVCIYPGIGGRAVIICRSCLGRGLAMVEDWKTPSGSGGIRRLLASRRIVEEGKA